MQMFKKGDKVTYHPNFKVTADKFIYTVVEVSNIPNIGGNQLVTMRHEGANFKALSCNLVKNQQYA